MTVTCIRNAPWVVAWDADRRQHYFRNDVDVVFEDNVIVHLDPGYAGHSDHLLDGSTFCVMPGMVNVHTHLQSESIGRGLIEELGNPNLYMTGILDEKSVFVTSGLGEQAGGAPAQLIANRASTQNAIAELLKSGATTVVDLAVAYDGWLDLLADTGIRAVAAPMYRDAKWTVPTGHRLDYDWNLEKGRRDFADALAVVDRAERHPSGRLGGMVAPMQVDTCSLELLRDSLAAARARGLKMTVHCSQHIPEFQEMVRRHGVTPVQWLHQNGLLGQDTLLGHALFLDHHSLVQWWTRLDLDILAQTGTSVAHCPVVFSRYGQMMEDVGSYIRKGVNVAFGTDTEPQNMAEEVRMASTLGARGGPQRAGRVAVGTVSRGHDRWRDSLGPRGPWPACGGRQGRSGVARPRRAGHAAGARPAAQFLLQRGRPRRPSRLRRRTASREGGAGADHRPGRSFGIAAAVAAGLHSKCALCRLSRPYGRRNLAALPQGRRQD